jgi:photosystem II stability/assembly factor-like uncharacterized protein
MRKFKLFITCFLFVISSTLYGQWVLQTQIPDSLSFRDVYFINDSCGWAAGDNNIIIKTSDAGVSWEIQNYNRFGFAELYDIYFLDENQGWAVGYSIINMGGSWGTVFHTSDGGDIWEKQLNSNIHKPIYGVFFTDNMNGWSVCNTNGFLQTNNGGEDWENSPTGYCNLHSIFFVNELQGWSGGLKELYYSNDGGNSWVTQLYNDTIKYFHDIFFNDPLHGWAVGEVDDDGPGLIYSTIDGGQTWVLTYNSDEPLYGIFFIDNYYGWVVGAQGTIIYSNDGGVSWNDQSISEDNLYSIFITGNYQGWIAGGNGLYHADLSMIVGTEEAKLEESVFDINVFPNPVHKSAIFSFTLKKTYLVSIYIFNSQGQMVEYFEMEKPSGKHRIQWDTEGLPAGMYYLSIQAGESILSRKVVKME